MRGNIIIRALLLVLVLVLIAFPADAMDFPHSNINNIGCDSCHFIYETEPSLLPPWTAHVPQDIDDTQYNTLCWGCHNDVEAPYVRTHSSLQTDNSYGDWTVECRTCHNPHYQKQFKTYGSESYLYSGTSTDIATTAITKTGAGWAVDEYKGLVVVPNIAQNKYSYKITGNTSDTLTIEGPMDLAKVSTGDTFAIIYGKLIKSTITLDDITITPSKTGEKAVKFFNSTGTNSYADGDSTYNGICEVCHTQTTYHKNDATGNHAHNAGSDCTTCHIHIDGFKGSGCNGCHGLPPVDAGTLVSSPGITGSITAGAHDLHVITRGFECSSCHYNSSGSGPTHNSSLTVTMGFSLFGGAYQGGAYDGQAGVNYDTTTTSPATSVSNTGSKTCSNTYCHSTGQSTTDGNDATPTYASPVWDDPASAVCGTCHKVTEATGLASGSHAEHLGFTGVNGCGDCHTGAADDASSYNSSNHVNASIDVSNTYSAGGTPGNGYGICSTASCHDDGTGNPAVTPTWGTNAAPCTSCHVEAPGTGSHTKHLSTTLYSTAGCGDCHDGTVQGTTEPAQHLDGDIDVYDSVSGDLGYPENKTKGTNYSYCSSAYCHSTGQSTTDGNSATPTYDTPTWGNPASATCGTCHDIAGLVSGSHAAHLGSTGVNGCGDCHTGAADDASSYNSVNHVDGLIEVANTYSASGVPGNGYGTCSTALCHEDGTGAMVVTPTWGTSSACTECHTAVPTTGSHTNHLSASGVECNDCHDGAVQGTSAPEQHLDDNIDVYDSASGDLGYPENKTKGSAYTNCTTASCHDDGTGNLVATPVWGTSAAACTECHAAAPASGSHTVHLAASGVACNDCHDGTVQGTTAPEQHLDTNIDVYDTVSGDLGYTENKTKGSAYTNCTTASCHDDGTGTLVATPNWGVDAANCTQCHAAAPVTGSHTKHLSTTQYETADCADCHDGAVESTTAPAQHLDNNIDVYDSAAGDLGYTQDKAKGSAYTTCSTAYCHSTGQSTTDKDSSVPSYATVTWGDTAACGTCHKVTEASGLTSGSHAEHLGTTGVSGCGDCHTGAANDASAYNSTNHVNGQINVASTYTAGGAPGNDYGTCSTALCHDDGTGNPAVTPTWGTAAAACTECHAAAPASGSHTVHLAASGVACNDCHDGTVQGTTAPAQHLDDNIDVYDSASGDLGYPENKTKGSAYTTCSTASCHSNGLGTYKTTPTWGTSGTTCNSCHNDLPTSGAHSIHVQTAATAYGSTSVSSTAGNYDYGCGNCHPVTEAGNHRDGTLDITLNKNHAGTLKSKNGVTNDTSGYSQTPGVSVTCSAAYCHSDTKGNYKSTPDWYSGSFAGDVCANCHGNSPGTGSHSAHAVGIHYDTIYSGTSGLIFASGASGAGHGDMNTSTTINCNICHNDTLTVSRNDNNTVCNACHNAEGNAIASSDLNKAYHVNGSPDIAFANVTIRSKAQIRDDITTVTELNTYWQRNNNYKAGATSNDSSKATLSSTASFSSGTCSTVACHNGNSVDWGDSISCDACHTGLP